MSKNNHINYIEFYTNNLNETKSFYKTVFEWSFTDYGPNYASFSGAGIDGGFEVTEDKILKGALAVIHHDNLESVLQKVKNAGGTISKDIFSFPGGKRFQFVDPTGNELAVWFAEEE